MAVILGQPKSIYDRDPTPEEDLWFLPQAPDPDETSTDLPWPVTAREGSLQPDVWLQAERACYRELLVSVEAVTRFGERLKQMPIGIRERFALQSVSAILRAEGVWLGPEKIALYRASRLAGEDEARALARASWAVRRLTGQGIAVHEDLRAFLGRADVTDARDPDPYADRPVGGELDALGTAFCAHHQSQVACHEITRAACDLAFWRSEGITPWDELLEPVTAAMIIGAGGLAPFLPVAGGHRFDRYAVNGGEDFAEARLRVFYAAVEAGALAALMELDRLKVWLERARLKTQDLSGRTPPALTDALTRFPILSADLVAQYVGCSPMSARRNLNLFTDRGLAREITGQGRYRFWAAAV
ncbi:helix-turn-helix domain-containing protein [Ruegeria marina]|uniref:HTH DNA binding domain-containing protein n=1 Tax=Ruegeria marina TaxID=639004 RepID=A0A1G7CSF0_9RHOB|nr:helix-turn-helix domain-containing protein [Ruegeria marina]SDE42151.1 HTH DNA binding domain-containing protein [Ruegeria marina]